MFFTQGAFGAVLVYDLDRESSFEMVPKWKAEIDSKVLLPNGKTIPIILMANKSDLVSEHPDKVGEPLVSEFGRSVRGRVYVLLVEGLLITLSTSL